MSRDVTPADSPAAFVTTRWTQVLSARGDSPEAHAALSDLCTAYYAPVLAFIRRSSKDEDAARDLTQGFFARLLARHGLDTVEPGRARFRSYLLGAVKNFLASDHERACADKRGGGLPTVSLDSATDTTTALPIPDPAGQASDEFFDREWARAIVSRALDGLAAHFAADGKGEEFDALKPWLLGELESLSQADTARRLGLSEGAVKVAIHRVRKRFRETVKAEIAQTVGDPAQVQEELRYLVDVLSKAD
ncbi:MAG: sigma-70 family RNA polymerase sigma factor [Verrucomicrobia bacterium]|nr:sigma-70 family RNA polymerase sigma factor [Verrucomicrobiota bacterium]